MAVVDWERARRTVAAITRPGPRVGRSEAVELVASLREAGQQAPTLVGEVTGLQEAAARAARLPILVVDRPRWAEANLALFAALAGDLPDSDDDGGAVSAWLAGEELGVALSVLSSRVLGQFDPFTTDDGGRLLLVAPNVLQVQRALDVVPADFQLWVALHEQTHAVQFSAAPWLAGHLRAAMAELTRSLSQEAETGRRMRSLVQALPRALSSREPDATSGGPILGAVLTDDEQTQLESVLAVMSLLEGHADVVMDAVGPTAIPTVRTIRRSFDARRGGRGAVDTLLRRLLGLDVKLAQYRAGAAFVRGVVDRVGHVGLNMAWTGPQHLPTASEIADPAAWVRRVHTGGHGEEVDGVARP